MPKNPIMGFEDELKRVVDAAVHELTTLANLERDRARQQGVDEGRATGLDDGHSKGFEAGQAKGFDEGHTKGFDEGRTKGFDEGRTKGFDEGHGKGFDEGRARGATEGRAEGWEDGREHGRAEGREEAGREAQAVTGAALATARFETTAELDASERLVDAVRAFDRARTLGEILEALATSAQREAARAAVVIVRGDRLRGWRLAGFDSATGDGTSHDVADIADVALAEAGVIAEAVRTAAPVSGKSGHSPAGPPAFAALSPGQESFAAPITLLGEVVAVLYADTEPSASGASTTHSKAWPERLEVLTSHAARCLERLTALKAARALTGTTDPTVSSDSATLAHGEATLLG